MTPLSELEWRGLESLILDRLNVRGRGPARVLRLLLEAGDKGCSIQELRHTIGRYRDRTGEPATAAAARVYIAWLREALRDVGFTDALPPLPGVAGARHVIAGDKREALLTYLLEGVGRREAA